MKRTLALILLSIASIAPLAAADVYRWVDEKGRTQFSDKVPDKYKGVAVRIEQRVTEASPAQRSEAEGRAAKERDASLKLRPRAGDAAPRASAKAPAPSDCAVQRSSYRTSQECYSSFRNANGSIRAEAAASCGPAVPDPAAQCGAVSE